MGAAGGSPALWATLPPAPPYRGDIPWKSMDSPPRPPMLPFFGNVRAWMLTPEQIVSERPGPPPATSSPLMARELAEVRVRRSMEPPGAGHRQLLGRRPEHADTARPLDVHRGAAHPQGRLQRGARRAGVRASSRWWCTTPPSAAGRRSTSTTTRVPRTWIPTSNRSSACRTFLRTRRDTRPSRARPPKSCRTSSRTTGPNSRG